MLSRAKIQELSVVCSAVRMVDFEVFGVGISASLLGLSVTEWWGVVSHCLVLQFQSTHLLSVA